MVAKGWATEREIVLSEISVCVVDDDESVRLSIGALIRSLGYTAHGFDSAEGFLNSAEAAATDCLITDVQMPGLSGIDLQKALNERGRAPPVIFITAFPQDRIRRQAMAAGALSFLSKPCDDDLLVRTIEEAVSAAN
jgi:FixJ family two-component response regulator